MKKIHNTLAIACLFLLADSAAASIYTFSYTGRVTFADENGDVFAITQPGQFDPNAYQYGVVGELVYDSTAGMVTSANAATASFFPPITIYNTTATLSGTTMSGSTSVDINYAGIYNVSANVQWDVTGLLAAITTPGILPGDTVSGNVLWRDGYNGGIADGLYDGPIENVNSSLGSVTPYSDSLMSSLVASSELQGPAPLAATVATTSMGSPFAGASWMYWDLGSGNSMHLVSVSDTPVSEVPVPAAAWLFGSGLIALLRRVRSTIKL